MKSRTSFFDPALLRRDITRFAPAWALYSVGLVLMYIVILSSKANYISEGFFSTTYALAIINCGYALICGQLLFGDLFSTRMANALHALPVRRETWFVTHMAAGLLFSLVPNTVMALAMVPYCGSAATMPWLWLLTNICQYVFFFGLAAVCALCVGSRFAMVVVYALANFGALLIYWLLDTLYVPLLYGVVLDWEFFAQFSPVVYATIYIPYSRAFTGSYPNEVMHITVNPEFLGYIGILALIGILLALAALVLYRRRHLEAAGDFIAADWMKPVFLVLYTLMMGAGFQFLLGMFGTGSDHIYLVVGILVGYFTGQMLLRRTSRVFGKKSIAGFAVFAAVLLASLGLTALDPMGITRRVPAAADVASVSINYEESQDPEVIQGITQVHQAAITDREFIGGGYATALQLTYTMKDGSRIQRYYLVEQGEEAHQLLEPIMSRPEFVLEIFYTDPDLADSVTVADYSGKELDLTKDRIQELLQVILLDCEAGTMAQGGYHFREQSSAAYYLYFEVFDEETRSYRHITVYVYDDAENTLAWLKQQGFYQEWAENVNKDLW